MFSKELTFCYQGKFDYNKTKYQCILMNSIWLYKVSNKFTERQKKNIIMLNYETRKRKKMRLRKMEYIQTTQSIPGLL